MRGFPSIRIATATVLVLSELTIAACLTMGLAGQQPAKPAAQPDKSKPSGRKPKEEVEEPVKPPQKAPLRVGDEDLDTNPSVPAKRGTIPPPDLKLEAKRAKHPLVQELFNALAEPHDVVTMVDSRAVWNVEPIAEYIPSKPAPSKSFTLRPFDAAWKPRQTFTASGKEILHVEPYEQLAVKKVDEFLKHGLDQEGKSKPDLPRLGMLQQAEKVLGAVLLFHDSAMERGLRKGSGWNELRNLLVAKLREVQLSQVQTLAELKNWDAAIELGIRLGEAYPGEKKFQASLITLLAKSAREALQSGDYDLTRRRLLLLEPQFPNSAELDAIRSELQKAAQKFLNQAKEQEARGQTQAARARLEMARKIYPELPGLRDFDLRLSKENPILYVGVHDFPKFLSPARAALDSEKQAVELLFESLLEPTYSPKMGQRFQPVLAADMPKMIPLGRQFTLAAGARWSNNTPVSAADVRRTVDLLCDDSSRSYIPEWAELFKDGARIGADNRHISLTLRQGYLDPLSLMGFKVLPQSVSRADAEDFATNPIGSGPYQLHKSDTDGVVFIANPFYEMRSGKTGLPRIREIHFVHSENPANDFPQEQLHLLLDLSTRRYKELNSARLSGLVTFKTLPNRRIYFLAVNHRRPPLDSQLLRRAITHAIQREAILDQCFRAGLTPPPHRPLNGPYPPHSWAYNRKLKPDPYDPDLAKTYAKKASDGRVVLRKLTLKYPKGDPDVQKACEMIQTQVQQLVAGIDLELLALEPRELQRDVEEQQNYDLAYYSWDYPDETYWLWPLLDPQAAKPNGRNFLNYQNDADLQGLFRNAMSHRDPIEVQRITHQIHADFADKMPFIPLWQLDTHLAVHKSLSMVDGQGKPVDPDPLRIFTSVATWTLEKH